MTVLGRIDEHGAIQLDKAQMELLRLEAGSPVIIEIESGRMVIAPVPQRDGDEPWYWTPKSQQAEREADEDLRAGRLASHATSQEFMASLRGRMNDRADA